MTLRALSLRSLRAFNSESNLRVAKPTNFRNDKQDADFDEFIQTTCKQFECPISVTVNREFILIRETSKGAKLPRLRSKRKSVTPKSSQESAFELEENNLGITAIYNRLHHLLEIIIAKYAYQTVPRVLMQVIALKVPFTQHLTKFTLRQCRIDVYTIYELNNILSVSNITDICLDHSTLKEGNYDILLSETSCLKSLSLSRCFINDVICERIASRLHHLEPAELTLMILNLSSNHITDVGCKRLGEALRTNRHLRYLNLADNHITDDGVKYIFEVLREFSLTPDERMDKNKRYLKYLKKKEGLYNVYIKNMKIEVNNKKSATSFSLEKGKPAIQKDNVKQVLDKDSKNQSVSDDELISMKTRALVQEIIGPFNHPFSPSQTIAKGGKLYCIGNFVLCYLNLRYNNLTYRSVRSLAEIVHYQKMYRKMNENLCGLVRVLLEGNYLSEKCIEYTMINKELI